MLLNKFATVKDFTLLKRGKLSGSSNQKNPSYKLPSEDDLDVEHGFVENFCQLFQLRERLRTMRLEIEEKGYFSKYTALMGNNVFNATVYYKSSFFEKLFKPCVEELNISELRIRSTYMVMSLKAQINSLKLAMNKDCLIFIHSSK